MIPVKENPDFARSESGAIVNVNKSDYELFLEKRNKERSMENRISRLENSIDRILQILEGRN
jgi:hypothetical protein